MNMKFNRFIEEKVQIHSHSNKMCDLFFKNPTITSFYMGFFNMILCIAILDTYVVKNDQVTTFKVFF